MTRIKGLRGKLLLVLHASTRSTIRHPVILLGGSHHKAGNELGEALAPQSMQVVVNEATLENRQNLPQCTSQHPRTRIEESKLLLVQSNRNYFSPGAWWEKKGIVNDPETSCQRSFNLTTPLRREIGERMS